LSVVLKPQDDTGSLTFSLFLPPVTLGVDDSQSFMTYGLKTDRAGSVQTPGAQMTYEWACLTGNARVVVMPL
jgi:BRCT domain type II-containing protein